MTPPYGPGSSALLDGALPPQRLERDARLARFVAVAVREGGQPLHRTLVLDARVAKRALLPRAPTVRSAGEL